MKVTTDLLKNNLSEDDLKKVDILKKVYSNTLTYFRNNNMKKYIMFMDTLTDEERDLILNGNLSDEIIEQNINNGTNRDRGPDDVWQTTFMLMFQKIVTEILTIVFFNTVGNRFNMKLNDKATKINTKKVSSDPDMILYDKFTDETFYIEIKAYYNKEVSDEIYLKEWQYYKIKQYIQEGKNIAILHKYYNSDGSVLCRMFDFEDLLKQVWYERDVHMGATYYQAVYTYAKPSLEYFETVETNDFIQMLNGEKMICKKQLEPVVIAF